MLVGAVALTHLNILPHQAPTYAELTRFAVPVEVFLLLLRMASGRYCARPERCWHFYLAGAATSIIGILVAFLVVPVPEIAKIAAVQAANLVGGTVNVIAVSSALQLDNNADRDAGGRRAGHDAVSDGDGPDECRPGAQSLPAGAPRRHRRRRAEGGSVGHRRAGQAPRPARMDALHLAIVAMAVMTYAVSAAVLGRYGLGQYLIIVVTLVALLVANLAPRQVARLSGDREIGTMLMYLFFASLGVDVDPGQFRRAALFSRCSSRSQ